MGDQRGDPGSVDSLVVRTVLPGAPRLSAAGSFHVTPAMNARMWSFCEDLRREPCRENLSGSRADKVPFACCVHLGRQHHTLFDQQPRRWRQVCRRRGWPACRADEGQLDELALFRCNGCTARLAWLTLALRAEDPDARKGWYWGLSPADRHETSSVLQTGIPTSPAPDRAVEAARLRAAGWTVDAIAAQLGCRRRTVRNWQAVRIAGSSWSRPINPPGPARRCGHRTRAAHSSGRPHASRSNRGPSP